MKNYVIGAVILMSMGVLGAVGYVQFIKNAAVEESPQIVPTEKSSQTSVTETETKDLAPEADSPAKATSTLPSAPQKTETVVPPVVPEVKTTNTTKDLAANASTQTPQSTTSPVVATAKVQPAVQEVPEPATDSTETSASDVLADIKPENFVAGITNPYLTYTPGTTFTYTAEIDGETVTYENEVTKKTRNILGVTTIEVVDRTYESGELIEKSTGWYAQDKKGNVWLLGEYAEEEEGTIISWVAGDKKGALPGIVMEGNPKPGDQYLNDYYKDISESGVGVVSLSESVTVPLGTYHGCLKLREWTPQEAKSYEYKYFCKEVGGEVLGFMITGGREEERRELTGIKTK